jgi:23S rRNA (cytosine1962-C5)-methyltransferase
VRILQTGHPASINQDWFQAVILTAYQARKSLRALSPDRMTTGYRLVNGENDGLPGLVIDRYASTQVIKLYTQAWIPHLKNILPALALVSQANRSILRFSRSVIQQQGPIATLKDGMLLDGPPLDGPILFQENGLVFEADPINGQKTGFFLDQRDNRTRVECLTAGKSVLNLFAYTGGFSVYAARGGAREVVSVDISGPALEASIHNMAYNTHNPAVAAASHTTIAADVFEVLSQIRETKQRFDLIVIDPPMFAQNQAQVAAALSAYRKLTQMGIGVLRPGGTLVQASCSSRITPDSFFQTLHQAARDVGRRLIEIERTGHASDHPVRFKEGAYLKCLFAVVP